LKAVEVVARSLARAYALGLRGDAADDETTDSRIHSYVSRRWKEHEAAARRMLRELTAQPAQIIGAGASALSAVGVVNAIFDAMACEVIE
jgi:hypothetical protein